MGLEKVALEFEKRLDPDLPFYYHTSTHTWFSEGLLPDFNQQSMKRKGRRLPRRELPQAFSVRRATVPVHDNLTVRAQFHNRPMELPPPLLLCLNILIHSLPYMYIYIHISFCVIMHCSPSVVNYIMILNST